MFFVAFAMYDRLKSLRKEGEKKGTASGWREDNNASIGNVRIYYSLPINRETK